MVRYVCDHLKRLRWQGKIKKKKSFLVPVPFFVLPSTVLETTRQKEQKKKKKKSEQKENEDGDQHVAAL